MLKRAARRLLKLLGVEVRRIVPRDIPSDGILHAEVKPSATYSPWVGDAEFRRIYAQIRPNTRVDEYRCYELWRLAKQVPQGFFLEVGVWKGGTGCLLAACHRKTFLCDTFSGVVKAGQNDTHYKGGEHSDAAEEEVKELAEILGVKNGIQILKGVFPEETGQFVKVPIALCHINVDLYQSARDTFWKIWPLMVRGGVVVFDDYGFWGCEGVTRLVNELPYMLIHNLNGHAILVKL